jgi:hypothetical protein
MLASDGYLGACFGGKLQLASRWRAFYAAAMTAILIGVGILFLFTLVRRAEAASHGLSPLRSRQQPLYSPPCSSRGA